MLGVSKSNEQETWRSIVRRALPVGLLVAPFLVPVRQVFALVVRRLPSGWVQTGSRHDEPIVTPFGARINARRQAGDITLTNHAVE
jgi:hypothetical protein